MKLFKLLIIPLLLLCLQVTAQTSQTLSLRNSNNNLFRYGYQGLVTTTDATATTIATFLVGNNEAGMLEAQVIGFDSTNGDYVHGAILVPYKKTAGTLTLGTPVVIDTVAGTGGLSGGAVAFSASSNNILLKVTGAASKTVKWIANVRWMNKKT